MLLLINSVKLCVSNTDLGIDTECTRYPRNRVQQGGIRVLLDRRMKAHKLLCSKMTITDPGSDIEGNLLY